MTTFSDAARAEAELRYPDAPALLSSTPHNVAMSSARAGLVHGAVWARDHLAQQESTDAAARLQAVHDRVEETLKADAENPVGYPNFDGGYVSAMEDIDDVLNGGAGG